MPDGLLKKLAGGRLHLLQARIAEFKYLPAIDTDQVIVLAASIGFFI